MNQLNLIALTGSILEIIIAGKVSVSVAIKIVPKFNNEKNKKSKLTGTVST